MNPVIVTMTDSGESARALDLYIRSVFEGRVDSYFMTYRESLLSNELLDMADIHVFGLFACDTYGPYTAGIHAAERWLTLGKRVLLVSGSACAKELSHPLYWDLSSEDELGERMKTIIANPPRNPGLDSLKNYFSSFFRKASDPHIE